MLSCDSDHHMLSDVQDVFNGKSARKWWLGVTAEKWKGIFPQKNINSKPLPFLALNDPWLSVNPCWSAVETQGQSTAQFVSSGCFSPPARWGLLDFIRAQFPPPSSPSPSFPSSPCQPFIAVGSAGPQPAPPDLSGQRPAATAGTNARKSARMPKDIPDRCQKIFQICRMSENMPGKKYLKD